MSAPKRTRPEVGVGGNWSCPRCDNVNFGTRTECNLCKTMPDGNWTCQSAECRNLNFPHREACNRCQTPRPAGGTPGRGAAPRGGNGGYGMGMGGYGQDQRTQLGMQLVSMFHGSPNPFQDCANFVAQLGGAYGQPAYAPQGMGAQGKRPRAGAPQSGEGGNWACGECNNVNFPFRTECNVCHTKAPAQEGNWACVCGNINFPFRSECNVCKRAKGV